MSQLLKMAYSPCPNDTFIFHAWSHGLLPDAPTLEVSHADIHLTNNWAMSESTEFDLLKISYAALPFARTKYRLLPCGGALGRGCGPLLLTGQNETESFAGKDDESRIIAIPSSLSTAYLLLRLWIAGQEAWHGSEFVVMPFDQIMPAIANGQVDAGLVIHEARFTYGDFNLRLEVDLGEWWEYTTGHLIPLGAIVASRALDADELSTWIRASLQHAWQHPDDSSAYIRHHAQEMSDFVTKAHIELYVNRYSFDVEEDGKSSVEALFRQAIVAGLIPPFEMSTLW